MSEKGSKQVLAFTAETSEAAVKSITAFYAIATTAKIYHWQSAGSNFEGDHLLFDRIFVIPSQNSRNSYSFNFNNIILINNCKTFGCIINNASFQS